MLVKSIFVELRSRLRSCNVFIKTTLSLNKDSNLKIVIRSNCIVLHYYELLDTVSQSSVSSNDSLSDCFSDEETEIVQEIKIDKFCRIIPNSMSGLKIEKDSISFRVLTEAANGGNFYEEQLLLNSNGNAKKVANAPTIDINAGEEVKIICANCVNVISNDNLKFERILELPSENMDMSEWFCHCSHGHASNDHGLEIKSNKCDFLYRLTYFMVQSSILSDKSNKFNSKRNIYHCNRCLAWLGLKSEDKIKLFNSTVKISRENNNDSTIFNYKAKASGDTALNDFIFTIEKMSKEFDIGFQYAIMSKILLECNFSDSKKQYLLIWIMDKELQVLHNDEKNTDIKLKSSLLAKILYKIEDGGTEVEQWQSDPTIISSEISKTMFLKGVEHLKKMSLKIPEIFRITNGYSVSYLNV